MRIFGIDFTSAPKKSKPIVCCAAILKKRTLTIEELETWNSFQPFDAFLNSPGPWQTGFDLPFGQPAALIQQLGWPTTWSEYVKIVSTMTKQEFVAALEDFSRSQPAGQKHLFRETDRIASACSPMMIYGVPVAKMFYEAAPRLLNSAIRITPCRANGDTRSAVETYPALVARQIVGRRSYKSSTAKADSVEKRQARSEIADGLTSSEIQATYGVSVQLPPNEQKQCTEDFTGDKIDSVLCCLQAAWSHLTRNSGVPSSVNTEEGWIVDPTLENR